VTTENHFDFVIKNCLEIFSKKMKDYGSAWRILRLPSLTDQIYIKAQRIRSIQNNKTQKIDEGQVSEFIGIINYSVMSLIQIDLGVVNEPDMDIDTAVINYKKHIEIVKSLMNDKNHDYGEAWRDMRISSLTDLIIQKLLRVKQIEDNNGETLISEGVDANYQDIINYSVFALILLNI
tara:strand:+ start:1325 stop:1858 length:534 start_codon:yes stop_codon:yes gene_type:complete